MIRNFLSQENKKELSDICLTHGFKKRGQAFFRIHGDGVIQIIKFEYNRVFSHYALMIGLQSMYSTLLPQHFTSAGSILKYYVFAPFGKKNAISTTEENGVLTFLCDPPSKQIVFLQNVCIEWLNSIRTQECLAKMLCKLEPNLWNDSERIAPFLVCGNYAAAERVISAILQQHYFARQDAACEQPLWTELPWTHELYERYHKLWPDDDLGFLQLHEWIYTKNSKAIESYLQNNYTQNCKLAKWLLR